MRASLKIPPLTLPRPPRPHSYTSIEPTAVKSEPAADKLKDGFPALLAGRVAAGAGVNPAAKWTVGEPAKSVDDMFKPGVAPLTRREDATIRDALVDYCDYDMTGVTDKKFADMLAENVATFTCGASDQPADPAAVPARLSTFRITMPYVVRHASYTNDKVRIKWFPPASKMGARDEPTIDLHYREGPCRGDKTKVCRRLDNAFDVLANKGLPVKASYLSPWFTDLLPAFLDEPAKLMWWLRSYVGIKDTWKPKP